MFSLVFRKFLAMRNIALYSVHRYRQPCYLRFCLRGLPQTTTLISHNLQICLFYLPFFQQSLGSYFISDGFVPIDFRSGSDLIQPNLKQPNFKLITCECPSWKEVDQMNRSCLCPSCEPGGGLDFGSASDLIQPNLTQPNLTQIKINYL